MTDLSNLVGFSVLIDDENGKITFGENISTEEHNISLEEIVPVLLNKYLKYPEVVYKYHPNIRVTKCDECEFSYHMFYVPYGLLGVEFVKTHVFYSEPAAGKYDSLIEVHSGSIAVIIQRNGESEDEWDFNTYVEELKVIHLSKGQKLAIPAGVFYAFVNTGLRPTVFSMITSSGHSQINYDMLKREKGLACFVISKNSKVAAVANPKYKMRTKLQSSSLDKFRKDEDFREAFESPFEKYDEPLINFMEKLEVLKDIFFK